MSETSTQLSRLKHVSMNNWNCTENISDGAYAKNNKYYINHTLRRNNLTKSRADDLI